MNVARQGLQQGWSSRLQTLKAARQGLQTRLAVKVCNNLGALTKHLQTLKASSSRHLQTLTAAVKVCNKTLLQGLRNIHCKT